MKHWIRSAMAFALALLVLASSVSVTGCASKEIVFVREDLDLDGEPRQILKVIEGADVSAAYFDGSEWIVVDDVRIPPGWLVVSPKLAEPEPEDMEGADVD